jgi:single-stranded DNA-binding protein
MEGGDSILASVIAFSETATRVQALTDGDAVSIAGSAKLTHWTDKEGEIRVGLDVVATSVLTAYAARKKRAGAVHGEI